MNADLQAFSRNREPFGAGARQMLGRSTPDLRKPQERHMFTRSTLIAIAAAATVGLAALAPVTASARGGGGGHGGGGHGGGHGGGGHAMSHGGGHGGGHGGMRGRGGRGGNHQAHNGHHNGHNGQRHAHNGKGRHDHHARNHHHRHHWHPHHYARWNWGGYGYDGGYADEGYTVGYSNSSSPSYASKPAAAPCTCLTKTYTDDGSVLFKDVCTQESAMSSQDDSQAQN
jgi:hypothetical protein